MSLLPRRRDPSKRCMMYCGPERCDCTAGAPLAPAPAAPTGWICPKCGAGVNPDTAVCPCTPMRIEVTCQTGPHRAVELGPDDLGVIRNGQP